MDRRPVILAVLALAACARPPPAEVPPVTTAIPAVRESPRADRVLVEDAAAAPWDTTTPEAAGLGREALLQLVEGCERTGTDALLVLRGDRAVVARTFGKPRARIELMSVTKGFAGIAVGFLLEEGRIASLDVPLSTWFPEWKEGKKARVTLRHVLTHMSGLAHKPAARELSAQKDRLAFVRALPIDTDPGETFSYNNEATQLLSGVIAAAAHEPIDVYLKEKLFDPLGVHDVGWERDAAGNVATFYGLSLTASDLAKVGVALRDRKVIPSSWIDRMTEPAKKASWIGPLTWLLYDGPYQVQSADRRAALAREGFGAAGKLAPLDGRRFPTRAAYWLEAGTLLAPVERDELARLVRDDLLPFAPTDAKLVGFDFNGWLGQYLVVYPRAGVVAVRQRRAPDNVTDEDNDRIGMKRFVDLLRAALPED